MISLHYKKYSINIKFRNHPNLYQLIKINRNKMNRKGIIS